MEGNHSACFNISSGDHCRETMIDIDEDFSNYLERVLNDIYGSSCGEIAANPKQVTAEDILKIILSKEFNYQSKKNVPQKKVDGAIQAINGSIKYGLPIKMYFAVGGGYKAAIDSQSISDLNFSLGLGEVLVLYQMARLEQEIKKIYPQGILFYIVLDNGVANYVNDIPVRKTEHYAELYRDMISKLGKASIIKLVVQTEAFDWPSEAKKIEVHSASAVSEEEYNNILRFIGRKCTMDEAVFLKSRYVAAMEYSAKLFGNYVGTEMWFVQNSAGANLTFRPFPGGASRIQAGDVALKKENHKVMPFLLSTKNFSHYDLRKYQCDNDTFLQKFLWSKCCVASK